MQPARPIIVVGTPRSGTSLTAGLFAQHGVWVGPYREGDQWNARGYFESLPFKELLIANCGRIVHKGILAPRLNGWRDLVHSVLQEHGYRGGPWLVKHSAMYWPVWHEFHPIWVCCRRRGRDIAASGEASGMLTRPEAIKPHVIAMAHLRDFHGATWVWPERFIEGDFRALLPVFEEAGLTFDLQKAQAFVDPSLWHYRGEAA